jgi:hypothetical protein
VIADGRPEFLLDDEGRQFLAIAIEAKMAPAYS